MEDRHLLKRLHQMVHLKLNCFSLVDILKVECVWLNAIKYIINFAHHFPPWLFWLQCIPFSKVLFHPNLNSALFFTFLYSCILNEFLVKIFNLYVIIQLYFIGSKYLIQTFTNLYPPKHVTTLLFGLIFPNWK